MAIPNEPTLSTHVGAIKRGTGRGVVGFAAYISGTAMEDERTKELHDWRKSAHRVDLSELLLPDNAPAWCFDKNGVPDREALWNRAASAERRKDSQEAREVRFTFSYDLNAAQREAIARKVAARFTGMGMCVDLAIHGYSGAWRASDPRTAAKLGEWQKWGVPFVSAERAAQLETEHVRVKLGRDGRPKTYELYQPHCHLLMSLRPFDDTTKSGFAGKTEKKEKVLDDAGNPVIDVRGRTKMRTVERSTAREWNAHQQWDALRDYVAKLQNEALADSSSERRLDPRGYEERREEAKILAATAREAGDHLEAARQATRAAQLNRQPEQWLGVVSRLKNLVRHTRERYSQWVAIEHGNEVRATLNGMQQRDATGFVRAALRQLDLVRRGLGLGSAALGFFPPGHAMATAGGPGLEEGASTVDNRSTWAERVRPPEEPIHEPEGPELG